MCTPGTLRLEDGKWVVGFIRVRPVYHTESPATNLVWEPQNPEIEPFLKEGGLVWFMQIIDGTTFYAQIKIMDIEGEARVVQDIPKSVFMVRTKTGKFRKVPTPFD